jgi:maltooligosyltrehalose trehalohydrolase
MMYGALLLGEGRVRFRLWAPSVGAVKLQVAEAAPINMQAQADGWFVAEAEAGPGTAYKFILPDGLAVPDPASRSQANDVHGASLVVDPQTYTWRNTGWRNRPWHEAVIYELHPGVWGGFNGIRDRLPYLASLGITAIELMPIADFPGKHNWGYDGVLPYAPDRAYGTPEELKALVDAAHGHGLMIFLDVVYNHFGPDGAYLHAYAKEFFDPEIHTPWGAAIDFKRPEVRDYFTENALMWLNEYRFDGLRFDAVHAIEPQSFLNDLAAALRERATHPAHLILEHEGNQSSLLRGPEARLFDAQWADDWHHCLHVLLTGEQEGYYESFAKPAEQLARAMSEGFVFQGEISPHHGKPRGEPSADLPSTAFVICLQNHDQIGNRAMGERLSQLAHPEALAAAAALLLLSPNIPMLFMGEEWGSKTPFLFFTDHNEDLAKLVREGRRREFKHFAAFKDEKRREAIPDPNAASTFQVSVPDPTEAGAPLHAQTLDLHRRLLKLRHAHIIPGIPGCRSTGARALSDKAVIGTWRLGNGTGLALVSNFGDTGLAFEPPPGRLVFSSSQDPADTMLPPRTTLAYLADAA